jgi:hypothetical protein
MKIPEVVQNSILKWFNLDQGLLQRDVCENKFSIQEAKKMLVIYTESTDKLYTVVGITQLVRI